jgi:hypothetical protein
VADQLSEPTAGQRHDKPGQGWCQPGADLEHEAVHRAQERRQVTVGDELHQLLGGQNVVAVSGDPVHESHREPDAARIGDDRPHPVGGTALGGRLGRVGLGQPAGHDRHGVLGQGVRIDMPARPLRRRGATIGTVSDYIGITATLSGHGHAYIVGIGVFRVLYDPRTHDPDFGQITGGDPAGWPI